MTRRGNPYWGQPMAGAFYGVTVTEFERVTAQLKLSSNQDMLRSQELKDWIRKHRNHNYVPEWLLEALGFDVELNWGE
jgi:hypothetical protein